MLREVYDTGFLLLIAFCFGSCLGMLADQDYERACRPAIAGVMLAWMWRRLGEDTEGA